MLVLYGSQTGNAESIAKDLQETMNELDEQINSLCFPLNHAVDTSVMTGAAATIIGIKTLYIKIYMYIIVYLTLFLCSMLHYWKWRCTRKCRFILEEN